MKKYEVGQKVRVQRVIQLLRNINHGQVTAGVIEAVVPSSEFDWIYSIYGRWYSQDEILGLAPATITPPDTTIRAVDDLKPCPCGKTPEFLRLFYGFGVDKYCSGSCCDTWCIGFSTPEHMTDAEIMDVAIKEWNEAPRGEMK